MLTPAPSETAAAPERVTDPCQWSGPARPPRRDLLERERHWMAMWDRYLAERAGRPAVRARA